MVFPAKTLLVSMYFLLGIYESGVDSSKHYSFHCISSAVA